MIVVIKEKRGKCVIVISVSWGSKQLRVSEKMDNIGRVCDSRVKKERGKNCSPGDC